MKTIEPNSLYLVLSREYNKDKNTLEIAEKAILGGVDVIQMREKSLSQKELIDLGSTLAIICARSGVRFIVNDDPSLAIEVNADGVHLGQEDLKKWPINKARKMLGEKRLIGVSTHSVEQFKEADRMDIDYISFGPVFETKAKDYSIGTGDIETVLALTSKPVFFIGGINQDNIDEILRKGGSNIAVIRAIMQAENVEDAARELKDIMVNGEPR